jgi:hypothetical protein
MGHKKRPAKAGIESELPLKDMLIDFGQARGDAAAVASERPLAAGPQ